MEKTLPLINSAKKLSIDAEDYSRLAVYAWKINSEGKPCRKDTEGHLLLLSREVMKLPPGDSRLVRYINQNYLDNRKQNFRISRPRINRRTHKSSKGHIWPPTSGECRNFAEACKNEDLAKIKVRKDDIVDLIENAAKIQWRIKRIIFYYDDPSIVDEKKSVAMFSRFLNYYFDWENRFDIKPAKKKEQEEVEEKKQEEEKPTDTHSSELFTEDDDEIILPVVDEPMELATIQNKIRKINYRVEPLNLEDVKLENLIAEIKRRGVECKIVF